jgi:S-DNA-T family DNA segregation ATPase FtsK/SpoIIIE
MGIELPNADRQTVSFKELAASEAFEGHKGALPIILGKDIAGEPIVADLAAMPHLLVAGTTGSGKSVGLNTILLSLLYRFSPVELRLILIDPKILELKSYDDIPHLLSPVVTDPAKSVRALKWAVEEMEKRYRMMSDIGARNIGGFNERVRTAIAKGKPLGRRVQTGFDPETGEELYEEEQLDYEVLPQIVLIVDELADLMVTVGKEIEVLISWRPSAPRSTSSPASSRPTCRPASASTSPAGSTAARSWASRAPSSCSARGTCSTSPAPAR